MADEIRDLFYQSYVNLTVPVKMVSYREEVLGESDVRVTADMLIENQPISLTDTGNGLLDAFTNALEKSLGRSFEIVNYHEHALTSGTQSKAITYVQIKDDLNQHHIGAGISSSISKSSLRAVVSAVNRMLQQTAIA